ncbi:MAG: hypothetical protein HWN81_20755 [Candidatus Lokiarchaeota archaeon]|nr:hypothetical protein [Candidatus Lokiarchaeota archaeon]
MEQITFQNSFKTEILSTGTRILRPREFKQLLEGCPKIEMKNLLHTLLFTGMKYTELLKLHKNPEWFNREFIHIPNIPSENRKSQVERWVNLTPAGKIVVEYFLHYNKKTLPSYQSWVENLKCWARRANISNVGLNTKTTRKTWESWLMFYYPHLMLPIIKSQGHNVLSAIRYSLNLPFTEKDRFEMREFVEGWYPQGEQLDLLR